VLKILAGLIALGLASGPALAQIRQVTGTGGFLSEWELRGTLTERDTPGGRAFSGPVVWKHIGLCSVNGPQETRGDMSYEIARSNVTSLVKGIVSFGDAQCTFSGNFSDNMVGHLDCPDAKGVPLSLQLK
jgi:hypothetical protein